MRVLLVNKFWYPKGGSERYTFLLRDLLESEGHTVIPFGMTDEWNVATPWAEYFAPRVAFDDSADMGMCGSLDRLMRVLWNRDAAAALDRLLSRVRPDVAHLQNFAHQISPSILPVLARHGVPIVWTLHDYKLLCPNYRMYTQGAPCERCQGHSYWNAVRYNCMGRRGASAAVAAEMYLHHALTNVYGKHIAAVIAPSAFLADRLHAWGWRGRIEVVPNCIEPFPAAPPPHPRDRSGVLFVGRLMEEKGVLDFLEVVRRLPKIPFVVIGNGPLGAEMQKAAATYANLTWHGAQPPDQMRAHYERARVLVVPSRWYENAPYVVLEAMRAGTPVIATRMGGLPELVDDGATGVLVPPRNPVALARAIGELIADEQLLAAFGNRAQHDAHERYGPALHYARLQALYAEVSAKPLAG
ncbi:glycosyltransferase [Candidatus Uhrbacteria bacterium]|nr:glycosyltransferase [Candidatus Uhrbacteria bacterium]